MKKVVLAKGLASFEEDAGLELNEFLWGLAAESEKTLGPGPDLMMICPRHRDVDAVFLWRGRSSFPLEKIDELIDEKTKIFLWGDFSRDKWFHELEKRGASPLQFESRH